MNKHKKFEGSHKPASIDGIIPDGRSLGVPTHRSYQPSRGGETPTLDGSASRPDGFHPMRQASGQSLGAEAEDLTYLDQPIELDTEDTKQAKKRRKLLKKQRGRRGRKWIKRSLLILVVAILGGLGYMGYKFYNAQQRILSGGGLAPAVCDANVPTEQLNSEGDGRINVLVAGIGGQEHADGPNATDTIMLVSIDPINHTAELLSIPRDLWVQIPSDGQNKINAAFLHGLSTSDSESLTEQRKAGMNALEAALKPVIDVPVHYHALVDFAATRQIVNAVDGVDINVPKELAVYERLWDEATGKHYTLDVDAGLSHFDGTRALFFSRSRKTSPRGDFDRTERQKLVMIALKEEIFSAGTLSNPVRVLQLIDGLGNNIYSDFDTESVKCMYRQVAQIPSANITSLDMATPPNELLVGGQVNKLSVVKPEAGLFEYDEINQFIRRSLPDGFIAKEKSTVAIYNATDEPGLATAQSDLLKSYGYNVTTVDSAPNLTNPEGTTIVDLTKGTGKYTRHYLQNRYGVSAVAKIPDEFGLPAQASGGFVIILGRDVDTTTN